MHIARMVVLILITALSACMRDVPDRAGSPKTQPGKPPEVQQQAFEVDGYYFPSEADVAAGCPIEHIQIMLPEVTVQLKQPDSSGNMLLDCPNPGVLPERIRLECGSGSQITLTVDGVFMDKRGQFWDRPDVEELKTIVLTARVRQLANGRETYSRDNRLTFWVGD